MRGMGTKEQLLRLLEENRERYVSGAKLAQAIGVSRNAVWKGVEALRAEGYAIDAVTNIDQENACRFTLHGGKRTSVSRRC